MQITKEMLQDYTRSLAVELGKMDSVLHAALLAYEPQAYASVLNARLDQLRSKQMSDQEFFPADDFQGRIDAVAQVIHHLPSILRG